MFLKKSKNKKREGVAKRVYDNTQKKKKNKGQKQIHYEPKLNSNSDLTIRMKIIPGILHQVAYILMCKLQLDVKGKSKKGGKKKRFNQSIISQAPVWERCEEERDTNTGEEDYHHNCTVNC